MKEEERKLFHVVNVNSVVNWLQFQGYTFMSLSDTRGVTLELSKAFFYRNQQIPTPVIMTG